MDSVPWDESTPELCTMSTTLGGIALVIALGAVALGGYALVQGRAPTGDVAARLDALDARLDRLETAQRDHETRTDPGPRLLGHDAAPAARLEGVAAEAPAAAGTGASPRPGSGGLEDLGEAPAEQIAELVDEAVARKAAELQLMQANKEPSIDLFARTLGLDEDQKDAVAEAVVRSQHEIREILEIPTDDGTIFMDELVEVFAQGIARPDEAPALGMKLFGRLMSEEIPGSNETYAERAEAVKERLRGTFRDIFDEDQYATFESWQMDPTEIEDIPGSPWADIETRVIERAKDLGAEIPEEDGDS